MPRYRGKYRTETTRLQGYDYASPGWYHVVTCTKDRACVFGTVRGGIMGLSRIGVVAHRFCAGIPDHFDHAVTDALVVMPNHVHAIIWLLPRHNAPVETLHATSLQCNNRTMPDISPDPRSLSTVIRSYKSAVTRWARRNGYDGFAWQPRFFDRVTRGGRELRGTRRYIAESPLRWPADRHYPD